MVRIFRALLEPSLQCESSFVCVCFFFPCFLITQNSFLNDKQLNGSISTFIGDLSSLTYLCDGVAPQSVLIFTFFRRLQSNGLTGTIPSQIRQFSAMVDLYGRLLRCAGLIGFPQAIAIKFAEWNIVIVY
jgi:hypothetical protein